MQKKSPPVFTCAVFSTRGGKKRITVCPGGVAPRLERTSALFPLGERRQFCVIKHCTIAFPRGPGNSDNCGNGIKKYGIKICSLLLVQRIDATIRSSRRRLIATRTERVAAEILLASLIFRGLVKSLYDVSRRKIPRGLLRRWE